MLVEMTIKEYEELVKDILTKNEFQRKRVRSSKTVYALLREDLLKQCVIPPIVLALTNQIAFDDKSFETELTNNKDHLVILDGLQRTHTIFDLLSDIRSRNDENAINLLQNIKLRIEIYVGLNRLGILYRMLTLNTGQTPMSLRQQIEMLYMDYLNKNICGVELIKESDGRTASRSNQYNFKDIVEGFNAYLDRDELPIDKANILENIDSLEKLSKENQSSELFEKYILSLNKIIDKIDTLCKDYEISEEYIEEKGNPFGKTALQVFKKPQAYSGFGAAIGKLIDFNVLLDIDEVHDITNEIDIESPEEFLEEINNALLFLKNNSKKIGNAQRSFFAFFFRDLLNAESDGFKDLIKSTKSALRKYQAQNT
ncbi:hypothetical protein KFZ76_08225 [Methylovulum psychrotolerans]|uniref:GmrSD restriction endonuclease domain-containing protein n=1 Tax=Methylovulum psychrotolerans TaxID=1704499 RepID=UPI001BFF1B3F|nr:DUF262 domain-containing protein [Methylovulum psychrotolerans]MBT9097692.1 hypothetical protein [Methylovulum psychrotolerans]